MVPPATFNLPSLLHPVWRGLLPHWWGSVLTFFSPGHPIHLIFLIPLSWGRGQYWDGFT